ncbi:hypothetical protein ACSJE9_004382, partial [Shigella flexneri]
SVLILMPALSKKAISTDESIKVPLGGFMSTSVSGKNVVLTNAEFTGAGDADGNAEISWKI